MKNRDTSQFVATQIIEFISKYKRVKSNLKVLEPSAGVGFLADYISHLLLTDDITCYELNEEKYNQLKNNRKYDTYHTDFLNVEPNPIYDLVIAAPPFKGNIDLEHIKHMYNFLKDDGEIVTLTSPYWVINNESHQVDFRKWLEDKKYNMIMLPDNSFSEKRKFNVPTAIIKISK